jgi:outer membrane biogenesis lipoprotein LolB
LFSAVLYLPVKHRTTSYRARLRLSFCVLLLLAACWMSAGRAALQPTPAVVFGRSSQRRKAQRTDPSLP